LSVLLKSVTGFAGSGLDVVSGFALDTDGSGDFGTLVGADLVSDPGFDLNELGMGDLGGSIERDFSRTSDLSGAISSFGLVELSEGFLPSESGAGLSLASELSLSSLREVSTLKPAVSSRVVGVAIFSAISRLSCVSILVGLLDKLGGLLLVGGVTDLALLAGGPRSRESDRLSSAGPKGVLLVGDRGRPASGSADTGVPTSGVESPLLLCAFARAMFSIQLGWDVFVGDAGLGESGFASALSIQLDLFGLQRFEGLVGGEVAPSWSALFVMYVEATDLLLLW